MEKSLKTVQCASPSGLHRMAYLEWGERDNPRVLVCVHGLTRNARDFDRLARALATHYRVICPDVVGRGQSSHLRDPAHYGLPQYVADMVTLIARLNVDTVHWVGTSMGGLIGMLLAAQESSPIHKLVLNDVGPTINGEALLRIGNYVGVNPDWVTIEEAEAYVRSINAGFGELSDASWRELTESSIRQRSDGRWAFRYDTRLAEPFKAAFTGQDVDLWPIYERITCPTLAVRGEVSDLLLSDAWRKMALCGPRAQLAEIPGTGHAPMFQSDEQIAIIRDFLLA